MLFKVKIEPDAVEDIQGALLWYDKQQEGLGKKLFIEIKSCIKLLKSNPFYHVRYDRVRCLPLKRFPFMLHFSINESEKLVIIRAMFNTYRDVKTWEQRKPKY
ncbi:MAG: hypothetical protein ABI638_11105 [Ignavibacteriota bacterium]